MDTQSSPIKYRDFDAKKIGEEIVQGASEMRASVEEYETAKTVSQRALDDEVCI